ncbi:MAG: response regulator [bacterium]
MPKKKVLIVDDDREFLEELQETLELNGYIPLPVYDSTVALNTAYTFNPDIILLDLKMNDLNGFQVAETIKKIPETSHIPIIAMTGYFTKKEHSMLIKVYGMEPSLKKPFHPSDLINQIELVLKNQVSS